MSINKKVFFGNYIYEYNVFRTYLSPPPTQIPPHALPIFMCVSFSFCFFIKITP